MYPSLDKNAKKFLYNQLRLLQHQCVFSKKKRLSSTSWIGHISFFVAIYSPILSSLSYILSNWIYGDEDLSDEDQELLDYYNGSVAFTRFVVTFTILIFGFIGWVLTRLELRSLKLYALFLNRSGTAARYDNYFKAIMEPLNTLEVDIVHTDGGTVSTVQQALRELVTKTEGIDPLGLVFYKTPVYPTNYPNYFYEVEKSKSSLGDKFFQEAPFFGTGSKNDRSVTSAVDKIVEDIGDEVDE